MIIAMKKSTSIFIFVAIILLSLSGYLLVRDMKEKEETVDTDNAAQAGNFEECVSAGYPVFEGEPRRCTTPDGRTFVENVPEKEPEKAKPEKVDIIKVTSLQPEQTIQSPLTVSGEAIGTWFFEASFPVKLLDGNGNVIASSPAQAKGDWMTRDFVPFEAVLNFEKPATMNGILVLEKDNPSGLPENADKLEIPVTFPNSAF